MGFDGSAARPGFDVAGLSPGSAAICAEWERETGRHPFFGEEVGAEASVRFWDNVATECEGSGWEHLVSNVLGTLRGMGLLKGSVLDVGSGPGTYSLPFAETAERVVALDSSEGMINRLLEKAAFLSPGNVSCILVDWNEYVPEKEFDLVFSSLCPGANSPASLLRMEAASVGKCAYVSSIDGGGALGFDVWRRLGKDYSNNGYSIDYPRRFLSSIGRKPFFSEISWTRSIEIDTADLIENTAESFRVYESLDMGEVKETVTQAVHERYGTGKVAEEVGFRAGLLIWDAPAG